MYQYIGKVKEWNKISKKKQKSGKILIFTTTTKMMLIGTILEISLKSEEGNKEEMPAEGNDKSKLT